MIAALLLLLAAVAEPLAPPPADQQPDIVVRARRGRCDVVLAGSALDGRALRRLADGWPAGRPLRVAEPRGASRACLTRITLRLAEQGFTLVQFVDPPLRDR